MVKYTSYIRVRYADTDQMRVVHHSKYFEYFELGRSDVIREMGMSYAELEAKGVFLPVIEAHAKYFKPACYDELISVETVIQEIPVVTLKILYRVCRNEYLLAEGFTLHGFVNAKTGKPTRAPKEFLQLFDRNR